MHVCIAHPAVIPVYLYGGTERDIWWQGKAHVAMGHKVTYLVKQGSTCPFAPIIPIDETRPLEEQIPADVDIVHFHAHPKAPVEKPMLITIHGNINKAKVLHPNTVFISADHARRHGGKEFVYNGMDWDEYTKPEIGRQRDYYHFLAKAAWRVKNVRGAIKIARRAGERLAVLGGTRLNFSMGFRYTPWRSIDFHGMVGGEEKCRLINGSKGLLFPVLWHEPFGLAVIESLYYGCPVFATPYGSLPELLPAEVGFLSNSATAWVERMGEIASFNRQHIHEYARDTFNHLRMTREYTALFERVLNGEQIHPAPINYEPEPTPKHLPFYE